MFFQRVLDVYCSLTVAELTGLKKNLASVLNWLPPVIFGPSFGLEPAPVLVPSLSFYLASWSFFYFCLANVRFSS